MRLPCAIAALAMILIGMPAEAAKVKKPPRGHFGSEWVARDGDMRRPSLSFWVKPLESDADIYRSVGFDWKQSDIQTGPYPADALRSDQESDVELRLSVDANGGLSDCAITRTSGVPEFDAHACPHLKAHARFHPALDRHGKKVARTVDATLSYILKIYVQVAAPDDYYARRPFVSAKPTTPVTAASLGITPEQKAKTDIYGIAATVTVAADAQPQSCLLTVPTFIDDIDQMICDRLLNTVSYTAATDRAGKSVEDRVPIFVQLRQ